MRNFYDTLQSTPYQLNLFEQEASTQKKLILGFMRSNAHNEYTPIQVHTRFERMGFKWLLTSVRRAMHTLTRDEDLIMHKDKKIAEKYGKPNHTWQFNAGKSRPDNLS